MSELNSNDANNLRRIVGNYSDNDMRKLYTKHEQAFNDFSKSMNRNADASTNKTLSNTKQKLGGFLSAMMNQVTDSSKAVQNLNFEFGKTGTVAEKSLKQTKKAMEEAHKQAIAYKKALQDIAKQFQENHKLSVSKSIGAGVNSFKVTHGMGSMKDMMQEMGKWPTFGKNFKALNDAVSELGFSLKSLIPGLVAFTAVGAAINALLQGVMKVSNRAGNFSTMSGGNEKSFDGFLTKIEKLSLSTRRSQDDIEALGMAYYKLGGDLSSANTSLEDSLTNMGQIQHLFKTSNEDAATYLMTLEHMGITGNAVNDTFQEFYKNISEGHLTLEDFNEAAKDGNEIWREFGGQTGVAWDRFTNGLLKADSLMRSFNIQSKYAAISVKELYGEDVGTSARTNAFTASVLGQSGSATYNKRFTDPMGAIKDKLKAAALAVIRGTGGSALLSGDQFVKQYGKNAEAADMRRRNITKHVTDVSGVDPGLLGSLFAEAQNKGVSAGGFSSWFDQSKLIGPGGSLEGAKAAKEKTAESLLAHIGNVMDSFWTSWGVKMVPVLDWLATKFHLTQGAIATQAKVDAELTRAAKTNNFVDQANASYHQFAQVPFLGGLVPNTYGGKYHNRMDEALHGGAGSIWNDFWRGGGTTPSGSSTASAPSGTFGPAANGLKSYGKSAAFNQKVRSIANDLGMNPDHLMAVMSFESGINASRVNRDSGATGLIQFMPGIHGSAHALGTSTEALAGMSDEDQLNYVKRYLMPHKGKMKTMQDAYMAVFSPKFLGSSPGTVMYSKGSLAYKQNHNLDIDGDGNITVGEAASFPAKKLAQYQTILQEKIAGLLEKQNEHLEKIAASTEGTHKAAKDSRKDKKLDSVKASPNSHAQKQALDFGLG